MAGASESLRTRTDARNGGAFPARSDGAAGLPETLHAHRILGQTRFYFGDFAGAHDHFQKTIELYDHARHAHFANRLV